MLDPIGSDHPTKSDRIPGNGVALESDWKNSVENQENSCFGSDEIRHGIRQIPVGSDKILCWLLSDPSTGLIGLGIEQRLTRRSSRSLLDHTYLFDINRLNERIKNINITIAEF
ncbi:unnamed protein product [Adineta ricciae]|uniref:Uncharacterized protein n=1 Tax=Adineta ricciae TaxID=249248 RepID=A0A816HNV5_ADIRI|nr:unnamed protein product [Adineta ricciae]CAF1688375.1 unnamed protein product [Adineta ricciae]